MKTCEPMKHDFVPAPNFRTEKDRKDGLGVMRCNRCAKIKRGHFHATQNFHTRLQED